MPTRLEQIRKQHPAYNKYDDKTLTKALHKKYQMGTGNRVDFDEFAKEIGFIRPSALDVAKSIPAQAEGGALQGIGGIAQAAAAGIDEGVLPEEPRNVEEIFDYDATNPVESLTYPLKVGGKLIQSAAELLNVRKIQDALKPAGEHLEKVGKSFTEQGSKKIDKARPKNMTFWQEAASTAGVSMGTMIPAAAAGFVLKSPSFVASAFGAQEFGRSFGEAKEQGLEDSEAFSHAWLSGMVEAGTEFLPAKFLFKKDKNLLKRFANFMAAELPGENIAELTQMLSERIHGLRDEVTMKDVMDTVKLTSAATLIGGSAQMTAVKSVEAIIEGAEKRADARTEAEETADLTDTADMSDEQVDAEADQFIQGEFEEVPDIEAFNEEAFSEETAEVSPVESKETVEEESPGTVDGLPLAAIASVMKQEKRAKPNEGKRERRAEDPSLRERIRTGKATIAEVEQAVYTDPGTGLHNKRAYKEAKIAAPEKIEAAIDGDSVKWVNDNMGHKAGDQLLQTLADELKQEFAGEAYRTGGDEFNILADDQADLDAKLKKAGERLKSAIITVEKPDGTKIELKGLGLTYGIGKNSEEADLNLNQEKERKTAAGERAVRSGKPSGVTVTEPGDSAGTNTEGQQDNVNKDVKDDDTGPGTLHSNPFSAVYKSYQKLGRKVYDRVRDAYGWKLTPLGKLKAKALYLKDRYLALGKIAQAENISKKVNDLFAPLSAENALKAYEYLTTKGAVATGLPNDVRRRAVATKKLINKVGKELVARGMISQGSFEKHEDGYLPRMYLKHLLGENAVNSFAGGKKPSSMGYTKERKDIPADVRELILGEITDPGYLASKTLGTTLRDIAILDWFEKISQNKDWALSDSLIDYKGKKVSVFWLQKEGERISKQIPYYKPLAKTKAEEIVKQINKIVEPAIARMGKSADASYKQVPDTFRYGRLRGAFIRKEIYDDIVGMPSFRDPDAKWWEAPFEFGGIGTKLTQWWKMSMVALNPPTQIRNFVSNGILLQMSGVGTHRVPVLMYKSIQSIRSNGKHWRIAKKYGITATTFSNQELINIEEEMLKLKKKTGKYSPDKLIDILTKIGKASGDLYGFSEALWKTSKIIDAMEREGKSESDAVLEAQKWLYDYSLVPKTVRYFRNAPVGAPFLTFYYFTLPRVIETLATAPHRFAPYIAIPAAMTAYMASSYDVEPEDIEKLKQALPDFLREHGHLFFLPYKDKHNRWVAVDFSYILPWGMFSEVTNQMEEGNIGEAVKTSGVLGGPIPDLLIAIKTNQDPFTGKPIAHPGDTPAHQAASMMNYLWSMAAPSFMTDRGALGRILESATDRVNPRSGEPPMTMWQSVPRLIGMNMYPIEPEKSRQKNLFFMGREIAELKKRSRERARDKNLTTEERRDIRKVYKVLIDEKVRQIKDYKKASVIHPNLRSNKPDDDGGGDN